MGGVVCGPSEQHNTTPDKQIGIGDDFHGVKIHIFCIADTNDVANSQTCFEGLTAYKTILHVYMIRLHASFCFGASL